MDWAGVWMRRPGEVRGSLGWTENYSCSISRGKPVLLRLLLEARARRKEDKRRADMREDRKRQEESEADERGERERQEEKSKERDRMVTMFKKLTKELNLEQTNQVKYITVNCWCGI